jgi:AsmA protein
LENIVVMKKFLIIFASLLVVLLLALLIVPNLINWNSYKSKIAAMVKASTGREFRIDGDIQVSVFPNLVFAMSGVHLANAPGLTHPDLMSIGTVSGKLRLLPLLRRRVVIDAFMLQEPAVNLEVDKDGRANWVFASQGAAPPAAKKEPSNGLDGLPINDLSLGEVRLTRGNLSLNNAQTGQTLMAKDIDLTVALANLASPLTLALRLNLNNEPVTLDLAVDSPQRMLDGVTATVQAAVASKFVTTNYQGSLQQKPVPGLSGKFDLNIPSVGQLATWIDRPLDRSQPDPGPLKVHATFTGDGKTVALTEATIEGKALKASATGSYDGSGEIARIVLQVDSDTLDIDRYLPPAPAAKKPPVARQSQPRPSGDTMAVFSPEPIDLSGLRKTEANVRIAIQGIKAMGYEIGQIDFTTTLKGGQLTSDIKTLKLYGGDVKGTLKLDGTGKALGVDARLTMDRVKVDKLASAAMGGEVPVTGIASGQVQATARGESPRRLVESLQGGIAFQLGGVDVKNAPVGAISDLKVNLDLPGIERAPSFKGSVVYNKQRVNLDLTTDPLKKVLSGEAFVVKASVDSKLVRLGYDGKVQQRPVPGLDGAFNLNVPSVGRLASWLGQPLGPSQPDPGPLKVQAVFQGDGAKVVLKTATIEGQELQARATGSFDGSGDIARIALKVESETLNIDRYLPPAAGKKAAAAKPAQASPAAKDFLASVSDTPFDLAALKKTVADVQIAIGGVRAMGYKTGRIALTTTLDNGLLTTELRELNLYGGNVKGAFKLDGSGKQLGVDAALSMDGVKVDDLAKTATGGELAVHGTASGSLKIAGQGASPKALGESISGKVVFNLEGVNIKDAKAFAVSGLNVELDLPGMAKQSIVKGRVVYNKEAVNLDLKLDSIRKALSGNPFAVKTAVASKVLNATYDGTIQQQPAPGLDGALNLDVPSVAQLMQWLDQPLDKAQPDPGPLKLRAIFAAKASQAALKEATISGKALDVTATGSVSNTGPIPVLAAKLHVKNADLNAYLPPAEPQKAAPPKKTPDTKPEPSGWSKEPLDLSALSKANGDIEVQIDSLRYRDLTIQPGHIKIQLKNGVFDAAAEPLQMSGGTMASKVHLDASGKAANLEYQLAITGLDVRPFLKTFANSDRLSGKTEFQAKGSAKGLNQKELVRSLNGAGQFKFLDGAIHGINIPATLRKAKTLGLSKEAGKEVKTDFAELSGSFVIKDGVLENRDLKMFAPLVRLSGEGLVPMPQRAIDYNVTAKLVGSLEGQGGKDALAGVPIPINVKGPWENISYNVDWNKVFRDIASDPERLKNIPKDLQEASKNYGISLPLPALPGAGKAGSPLDQLQQLQKQIVKPPVESAPAKQPKAKKKPPTPDALKTLKDLLKK